MSVIGNYIHFHQKNYISHGINKIHDTPSQKWEDAVTAFKKELDVSNEISNLMEQARFLEKQYNDLFYSKDSINSNFAIALQQFAQKELDKRFGLMAGKFNPSNLSVESTELYEEVKTAIDLTREKIGKINVKKNMTLDTFMKRINQLQLLLQQDQFKNINEIQPKLIETKQELITIANNIKKMINQIGGKNKINNNDINFLKIKNIIQEFNRVPLLYNQSGDLFEWVLPFIKLKSSNLAKEALVQAMNSLMKSQVKGDAYMQIKMPDLLNNSLLVDFSIDNIEVKTVSIRNKTDVIISYTDNNNQLQTKNVSAKSITGKEIKAVEDTTLHRILLLSQNYNFATHYLNIISGSDQGGWASSNQIYQANRLIKGLILKLSAQGYDLNNPSELLIVNNRQQAHIYVYNLKVLIYLIQKAIINNENRYSNLIKGMSDDYKINQEYQEHKEKGPSIRILKIIRKTQSVKISAFLNSSSLKNYLSLLKG